MIIVLLPVLDILPYSALIVILYVNYAILYGYNSSMKLDRSLTQMSNIWVAVSLAGVSASFLLNVVTTGSVSDPFNYLLRVAFIYSALLATNILVMKDVVSENLVIGAAKTLFILIVASAFFEYGLKAIGDRAVLSYFKARQDLGGIDTLHFNRFSGFWSYPGDAAAIIVLSIVLTFSVKDKFKFFKLCLLTGLLLLTQSKAGIALLLFTGLCYWLISFKVIYLSAFLVLAATCSSYALFIIEDRFEYLYKFVTNLPFYLEKSKRAQEVLQYFQSDLVQQLAGLEQRQYMYESEVFGSLSRLGFLGSLWLLLPIGYTGYKTITDKRYRLIWTCLFIFSIVYLSISAGMSRFKVLIPYLITFVAIHQRGKDDVR